MRIAIPHTLGLLACDPVAIAAIAAQVVADSWVDGAVVVHFTVQNERVTAALRRNGRGVFT